MRPLKFAMFFIVGTYRFWEEYKGDLQEEIDYQWKDGIEDHFPTSAQLYRTARKAREDAAPGMDGWKPAELKHLPLVEREKRRQVMLISYRLGKNPMA